MEEELNPEETNSLMTEGHNKMRGETTFLKIVQVAIGAIAYLLAKTKEAKKIETKETLFRAIQMFLATIAKSRANDRTKFRTKDRKCL